ncbi:transportin-3 [Kwoniella heveanensis BCC8398]|uniref:Transportin-3 n=1 Tax=Kwoniella heveanensis BCC8398 TaxID=1296120 RepID=A0A1B9GVK8_9TREE|nr:transportin-3 [Kwoniella heveanensis BCC8398]
MSASTSNSAAPTPPPQDGATAGVLAALQTLYHDPDSAAKRRANEWLEEFQHSVEAWQTCHTLLTSPQAPLEGRLFSAQTLRAKILYDLSQLPRDQLPPLRDSLLSSLSPLCSPTAPAGSKAVLTQLSLALSDLALQMPEWENVIGGMIDRFGKDPGTVVVLLGFLKALPEEAGNPKIPLSNDEVRGMLTALVSGSAEQVLGVLAMYIHAAGVTTQIQISVFETLRSWLQAGEVMASQVASTPLFNAAFDALASDQLFDAAVDVLCDLIHETQEVEDNVQVVQEIVPRVIALRPQLEAHKEDPDRIRGYCRILCEAGECYKDLIVRHPQDLLPLVQSIAECAAYPDLDIVPITFFFWYTLAITLGRQPDSPEIQPLLDIYANLQAAIISHLHFPGDDEHQTAQERDEFRTFRHRMGDTLKDCCFVLGAPTCLRRSYDLIVTAMSKGTPSWQEIEAPLFSMRSMGAEVDPDDDEVMPHIMDMLPKLPDHPRIRYAAILVISRYTQWIDRHPENLAFQLHYVSAGFDMADDEVSAAAAQAMKFMCQDCNQHLVPFLPQLHSFVLSVGDKMDQADMVEVCEAIGYIISSMPAETAAQALQQFCEPLIQRIQAVATAEGEVSKPDLQKVADALEQIDSYLTVVRTLDPVPESCFATCSAVYGILDTLLSRYAKLYFISERVGSVLRRGLAFFPARALEPVVQPVLERMALCFEETGYASYLWITGKVASKFGDVAGGPGGEALGALLLRSFESVTTAMVKLLQTKVAVEIPDVMDDYVHLFIAYLTSIPSLTLTSPLLHLAVSHVLSALTCPAPETILISLDTLVVLSKSALDARYHAALQPIFGQYGKVLLGLVIGGVVQGYPEDGLDQVQIVVGALAELVPPETAEGWFVQAVQGLPGHVVPGGEKQAFLRDVHDHLVDRSADKLKNALNNLVRAARRARERGRQARKSLGAGGN